MQRSDWAAGQSDKVGFAKIPMRARPIENQLSRRCGRGGLGQIISFTIHSNFTLFSVFPVLVSLDERVVPSTISKFPTALGYVSVKNRQYGSIRLMRGFASVCVVQTNQLIRCG